MGRHTEMGRQDERAQRRIQEDHQQQDGATRRDREPFRHNPLRQGSGDMDGLEVRGRLHTEGMGEVLGEERLRREEEPGPMEALPGAREEVPEDNDALGQGTRRPRDEREVRRPRDDRASNENRHLL